MTRLPDLSSSPAPGSGYEPVDLRTELADLFDRGTSYLEQRLGLDAAPPSSPQYVDPAGSSSSAPIVVGTPPGKVAVLVGLGFLAGFTLSRR